MPSSPDEPDRDTHLPPPGSLEEMVLERLRAYTEQLQGHLPENLYELIMPQLERPLVQVAMELAEGRQLHAAQMLGIHRNTLRKRLEALGLSHQLGRVPKSARDTRTSEARPSV